MISISENGSSRVVQFDGTNFNNWKYRLEILLDEKGLKQFIEEKLDDILDKEVQESQHEAIKKKEKQCVSIIVQSIHDSQLEYVRDKTHAKDMLDNLIAVFERKTIAGQLLLRKRLLTMKMHEGENINDHFLKFDKLIRDVKSVGATMEDMDVICHLLLTLPKTYDYLVTAIETMNPKDITLEFVKSRLLDEYGKRSNNDKGGKSNDGHAMQARNPEIVCFECGKKGHIRSMCKSKSSKGKWKPNANSEKKNGVANTASSGNEFTLCAFDGGDSVECANTCSVRKTCQNMNEHVTHSDSMRIKFVLDSGATAHMVNRKQFFSNLTGIDDVTISVAKKNQKLIAKYQGDVVIRDFDSKHFGTKTLKNVLLIEDLNCNLLSIIAMTTRGYVVKFKEDCATVTLNGKLQFKAYKNGRLYEVTFAVDDGAFAGISNEHAYGAISQNLLHFRLGHLNVFDMKKLISREMVNGLSTLDINVDEKFCESCVLGKQSKTSFPRNQQPRSSRVLELIHSDVCGPMSESAWDKSRYFVTFIDDFTRASMVFCIEHKGDVFDLFKQYVAMAESFHGVRVACLNVDNGGEYSSNNFKNYCKDKGIRIKYTVPYNPEMNSISERLNRTLIERARSMLLASGIEWRFWNEAVVAANYLKNRSPTSAYGEQFNNQTPAELWFGTKPDLSNIRIFGSTCYNHIPADNRRKLDAKSSKCIMLGYGTSYNTYRLWDVDANKMMIGRHVVFDEKSVLNRTKIIEVPDLEAANLKHPDVDDANEILEVNETLDTTEEYFTDGGEDTLVNDSDDGDGIHNAETDGIGNHNNNIHGIRNDTGNNGVRRSGRERRPVQRYGDWEYDAHFALSAREYVDDDPLSIRDAKQRSDWSKWKGAIDDEHESLIRNKTWVICPLPKGRKPISCKWVFKIKYSSTGEIDKYKARLVARGFTQEKGFDYNETYSPTAKLTTFRVLLAIALHFDYHIHQMDVKCAFLNGHLNEEIYMNQPEGFHDGSSMVCKLNRSLYGLKQASRMWNERFHQFMLKIKFQRCLSDHCLYVRSTNGINCYALLYVDDLLIMCSDINVINTVKQLLCNEFEMTDIGVANTFLGIHIKRNDEKPTIEIGQAEYFRKVLRKFNMIDCKGIATPIETGLDLPRDGKNCDYNVPYRELMGCLTYATLTTRPDLCAAVNFFSRYQSCFDQMHFKHAKRMLRYINATLNLKMRYTKQPKADILVGYVDADWAGDKNDRKSTSGYVFKVFGNTVSWCSRKQPTVSLSSTEAEYIALANGICEGRWLRSLLSELQIICDRATIIHEDNQSCMRVAEEPKEHKRMKHIDVKYNFIRESIAGGEFQLKYIPTGNQIADIMTKGLNRTAFEQHRSNLNLI